MPNRLPNRFLFSGLFCLLVTLALGGCTSQPAPPRAVDGVFDLRGWAFAVDGPVRLDGEWGFYWGKLLTVADLDDPEIMAQQRLIRVPGAWNTQSYAGGALAAEGVATYVLHLRFDADADLPAYLAIRSPTPLNTAHALYVDGELVGGAGSVGVERVDVTPRYAPYTAIFAPQRQETTIILQMANFDHAYGGPVEPLLLGSRAQIEARQEGQSGRNAFLIGSLFIMGIYHLGLFSLRRRERGVLYFGLFCLVSATAILSFQYPDLFTRFTGDRWSIFVRSSLSLSTMTMMPLMLFTHNLFPQESSSLALKATGAVTVLCVIGLLLLPIQMVTALIWAVAVFLVMVLAYTLVVVTRATARGRSGARILLLAHIPLIATIANDGLFFTGRLQTEQMAGVGILCFIFAQAYLLSVRFSNAFTRTEVLTEELRHSEEKYRAIFEESRDVILTTNRSAVIDTVNGAMLDLLGYTPLELIGHPLTAHFVRRKDGDALLRALAESGSIIEFAADLRHRNGHAVPCSITAGRRGDESGRAQGFQAIVHDMTAYRQAEAERERSLLLEKEKVKAEAASNAKSDFLATMSHELRTPLNSILGYAQILQDQTRLTAFQRRSVQTILANGRHLLNLIQDVLDLSRIEADRLTIVNADVALHPLVAEVVNAVQVKAEEKGLGLSWRVQADVPHYIFSDEKRLRQILLNLLSNAVHYTEAGEVALTVSCQHNEDNTVAQVRFEVRDTGVGLTQDEIERIFEPFEQAVTHDGDNQGLGLGLSISRRLARLLGGVIQVESSPRIGSRFWLDLPCVCDKDIDSSGEDVVLSHPVAVDTTDDADAVLVLVPPAETLAHLDTLARLGDMVGIEAFVLDLAATQPPYQPFAEQVTALARNFDDSAICTLITALRNTPPPS